MLPRRKSRSCPSAAPRRWSIPSASSPSCAPRATRCRRDYAGADVVIVNTCGFLDSAKAESLDAIGEAMAENGRVIVTGCMGAEPEQIRDALPGRARGHRPAAIRERRRRGARGRAAAARSVRRPRAAAGRQADAAPLRLSEDFRGLQQPLHASASSRRCAATSSAARPATCCARPRSWCRRASRSCW